MANAGSPHPKAGRALLPPDPPQVLMNLGIGPQPNNRVKLPRQRCFGEHGMKLAMAGGTEFGLGPMVTATGSWNQVVHRIPGRLAEAQLALVCSRLSGSGSLGAFGAASRLTLTSSGPGSGLPGSKSASRASPPATGSLPAAWGLPARTSCAAPAPCWLLQ